MSKRTHHRCKTKGCTNYTTFDATYCNHCKQRNAEDRKKQIKNGLAILGTVASVAAAAKPIAKVVRSFLR